MVREFFKSAFTMLKEDGQVQVTHKNYLYYRTWGITNLAKNANLILVKKESFNIEE
ncbi:hypothetical protein Hanom_Chr14g01330991 [Helianthus anomalus]